MLDWRPIVGCSPASAGCANCAGVKSAPPELTVGHRGRAWSGVLRLDIRALDLPLFVREPDIVAVCANGDLFHEAAPDTWLDMVWGRIDAAAHHQAFVILTKRSGRMLAYVRRRYPAGLPANVHLGVSAERQAEADQRLADLVATPPATRFANFYPLLGPIDCRAFLAGGAIRYVVAGEEPQRPARAAWFAGLERICAETATPFETCNDLVP